MGGGFLKGLVLALALWSVGVASAAPAPTPPDPRTVQRWEAGWRYPQAGWTVVHIEGRPYERGLQHGRLLAAEIVAYLKALAQFWGPDAPRQAWAQNRTLAHALFLRGFTAEQLQEMKGIADGAAAAGASFEGRALDLVDIVTLNVANEIDTLDDALQATANGLEGMDLVARSDGQAARASQPERKRPLRCSAFAATGPATRDGQLVFGHVTMYDLHPAQHYNVWLNVDPADGHRFAMQTTPGGIHSGMDYAINERGILISETTLEQTGLAVPGVPLAARVRQAQQYADSIEAAADILRRQGNGLTTGEWLLADIRRNEIAQLTLGTGKSVLRRSSHNEWVAGAEGFYWSNNNFKEAGVRLETVASVSGRPSLAGVVAPSKRDALWLKLYDEGKGRIDLDFARRVLTTPEIVSAFAVDAKYTDATLAASLQTWAAFGPPVGGIWRPSQAEQKLYPGIRPLVHNPWTVLGPGAPPSDAEQEALALDRPDPRKAPTLPPSKPLDEPAWRGTLLPASDADIWLVSAFAQYERIVALERRLRRRSPDGLLGDGDRDELGVELAYFRSLYARAARTAGDFALAATRTNWRSEHWFDLVSAKGVLLLHTLRGIVGPDVFDPAMEAFGRMHAGRAVASAQFQAFLQGRSRVELQPVFDWWLRGQGLPRLGVKGVESRKRGTEWETTVRIDLAQAGPMMAVPVAVETEDDEVIRTELLHPSHAQVVVRTRDRPVRVVVDPQGLTARGNGSPFTILTFDHELERTLIVYGTQDEEAGNAEAARALQQALRRREHNVQVEIRADRDVTEAELRSNHLLLVGRPWTHAVAARFADHFPVRFGARSFEVRGEVYAHPLSAVIVAADNPFNGRYSMVLMAGLGSLGTYLLAPKFEDNVLAYAPVVILPEGGVQEDLVPPLLELTRDLR